MNLTRRNFLTVATGVLAYQGGAPFARAAAVSPELDAGYPGGNARIVSREGDTFTLAPDLRDTKGWWFYFNFRLRGPTDQPATIRFADANPIGVRGPAMSSDGGRTWTWLGREVVRKADKKGSSFQAVVPAGAQEARYAFAPTYLESHLREWLAAQQANPALQVAELCRSRKDRGVELLRAGCLDLEKARGVVLLTARHHACETMASYTLEGFLTAVLADDKTGRRWRERWQVLAVPFADKDGVEQGDQGKNRAPHDHCRDYNDKPLYPEVAALMKLGDSLKQRVVFRLDMHCPYLRGSWNERVHFVGSPAAAAAEKEKAFAQVLERVRRGPILFRAADGYLPHGVAWNTPPGFAAGRPNFYWAGDTFSEARFTGAIEIPYADAQGVEVNADSARALGRDLARAALEHLEK